MNKVEQPQTAYAIITNPVAGKMSIDQKRMALDSVAKILNAKIHGLDTNTADDFTKCAQMLAEKCDVMVVAGGDGTLSHVINSVDTTRQPIAYLPMGSGNAMRHALNYKGTLADIARRINQGKIREFDLISCDGKKRAFMTSLGIEGKITRLRDQYLAGGESGIKTYIKATIRAYFGNNRSARATITLDESPFTVENLLTLMIVKQPYYGYGMKVVPKARLDDQKLHMMCVRSGLLRLLMGVVTAFTIGNRVGDYRTAKQVSVRLEQPIELQIDGNYAWESDRFTFSLLPGALRLKC